MKLEPVDPLAGCSNDCDDLARAKRIARAMAARKEIERDIHE